jgi:hypothetical protein
MADTHIPANLPRFPDMLEGWVGPAFGRASDSRLIPVIVMGEDGFGKPIVSVRPGTPGASYMPTRPSELVLDSARPEVRTRLAMLMARGLKCRKCEGSGTRPVGAGGSEVACMRCDDGWLRKPAPIFPLLHIHEGGRVENEAWATALVACSMRRVSAGLPPVAGTLRPWERWTDDLWRRVVDIGNGAGAILNVRGWCIADAHGPETGNLGRQLADRAALDAGFALAQPDGGLLLPEPKEGEK